MPFDRASRLDGIVVEVIKACWDFIGLDVLEMIRCFGDIGVLAYKILEGIIKLIPKLALK